MLKHEDNPQTTTQSAAKVRVTPEELAAAVTALQIRKEGQPGTIAIGDAVEELGLDVSPEEVLAEIQTRRIKPKRRLDYRALWCAIACVAAPFTLFAVLSLQPPPMPSAPLAQVSAATPPSMIIAPVVPEPAISYADRMQVDPSHLQVSDSHGRLMLASEVGDGQTAQCLFSGYFRSLVSYSPGTSKLTWTVIKHGNKLYIRGWTPRVSRKIMHEDQVVVTNHQNRAQEVPITLPLSGFAVTAAGDDGEVNGYKRHSASLHAANIHLDSHAYEKW